MTKCASHDCHEPVWKDDVCVAHWHYRDAVLYLYTLSEKLVTLAKEKIPKHLDMHGSTTLRAEYMSDAADAVAEHFGVPHAKSKVDRS